MTKQNNEADLESRLHSIIEKEFPWLQDEVEHQTRFSVKLGHKIVEIKGNYLTGRSDILVRRKGVPLAVFELKRPGISLTDDDVRQGLSYARLVEPMAPFVVVSNGDETHIYETLSGAEWTPTTATEQEFLNKIASAGTIAATQRHDAVAALMGIDAVWVPAINAATSALIETRTGEWNDLLAPFVRDFHIPRRATHAISELLKESRAIIVSGPPMSGKSNVLREIAQATAKSTTAASLMLEADSKGIFDAASNVLASELGWTVSREDARDWLRKVSHDAKSHLLLLIDGVGPSMTEVIADLNELCSGRFGSHLSIVVAIDDSAVDGTVRKPIGRREPNAFGRSATVVQIGPLDDEEFEMARQRLSEQRVTVPNGASSVSTLRDPWVLRALVPGEAIKRLPNDPKAFVRIAPIFDIHALENATKAFPVDSVTDARLLRAAGCIVDYYLGTRSSPSILHGISTLAVSMQDLEQTVGEVAVDDLRANGYLSAGVNWANEAVWFIRAPALLAKYVATEIARRLESWGNSEERAKSLIALSQRLPVGDVIAADALCQWARKGGTSVNAFMDLLNALIEKEPRKAPLRPGQRLEFAMHDRVWQCSVTQAGLSVHTDQGPIEIPLADEYRNSGMTDLGGWLILSHVAGVAIDVGSPSEPARVDEALLPQLGQSQKVLCNADGVDNMKELSIHELGELGDIVCHHSGIVEPITWSLAKYFLREGKDAEWLVDTAIEESSLPLLSRVYIALRYASGHAAIGEWALEQLEGRVAPAIDASGIHSPGA